MEGRKRYEFLEALVVSMDGHLRYFKRGYEVRPSSSADGANAVMFFKPDHGLLQV